MSRSDILGFLAGWPAGNQLNIYLDNGFNVVCTARSQVEDITSEHVAGHDFMGRPFLLQRSHITLFSFRPEGKVDRKGK